MVDKHKRRCKTAEYTRDYNVLVRIGYGFTKSTSKRGFSVEGNIFKKCKHSDNYKVLLIPRRQINAFELWVSTENICHKSKYDHCI